MTLAARGYAGDLFYVDYVACRCRAENFSASYIEAYPGCIDKKPGHTKSALF